jgi:hypothetical protein
VALENDTKWIREQVGSIAETVKRLEDANNAPHNTPAGRELLRRSDDAREKACEAAVAAEAARIQALAALTVLTTIRDEVRGVFRFFRWALAIVGSVSVVLLVLNNAHSLAAWLHP